MGPADQGWLVGPDTLDGFIYTSYPKEGRCSGPLSFLVPGLRRAFVLIPDPLARNGDGGWGRRKGMNRVTKWKDAMSARIACEGVGLLYQLGVHRSLTIFGWLTRLWPSGALAIFQFECGRMNTFVYCCVGNEEGESDPEWFDSLFEDVHEIIERSPSPMGHDEYAVYATRMGLLPGEPDGVPSGDPSYLTPTLERRPVIETIGVVGDRYYDWYKGVGKDDLMDLLRLTDPTPAVPVTVLRVLCAGQGYARFGKAMRLF